MRGNLYSRGFDPMKSRSERRKEKQAKLAKTKRVIRLKRRLGRIAARKFAGQEDSHMTALMESYILRRKAERAAERAKEAPKDGAGAPGEGGLAGEGSGAEESEMDEDEGSDSFSLDSRADSAFEVDDADDGEEEQEDIASSRRRAVQRRQAGYARGCGGACRGTTPRRGGASLAANKDIAAPGGKHGRGGGAGRGGQGIRGGHSARRSGRGSARGGGSSHSRQNTSRNASFHQRSRKVPTRSLY